MLWLCRRLSGFTGTPLSTRPLAVTRTGSSTPHGMAAARTGSSDPAGGAKRSALGRNINTDAGPSDPAASPGLAGSKRARVDDATGQSGALWHAITLAPLLPHAHPHTSALDAVYYVPHYPFTSACF